METITMAAEFMVLFMMAGYGLACELYPREVTRENSNAYTSIMRANFGKEFFSWQKLFFVVYHQSNPCWWAHVITFEMDFFAQYMIAKAYNVEHLLALVLVLQPLSFKNFSLWMATLSHLALVKYLVDCVLPFDTWYPWCAAFMILSGAIRSVSHMYEQLPPIMNGVNTFGLIPMYNLGAFTLWYKIKSLAIGTLSEMYAGLIFRLHYCVIAFCMDHGVLKEEQDQALKVLKSGFSVEDLETQFYEKRDGVKAEKKAVKEPEQASFA